MALRRWLVLGVVALGCASQCPPPATTAQPAVQANLQVSMTLRLNCEAICRQIARSCQQACRPQTWSPNMQSVSDACERDCDFNRFACTSECAQSYRGAAR